MIRRGIARQLGTPPNQKLPLTVPILAMFVKFLDMSLNSDLAFWSACLVGFYGLMRKSTLLPKSVFKSDMSLLRSDVVNLCEDSFVLEVRHSKTIQFGQRVLQIPFTSCAVDALCPVRALLLHLISSRLLPSAPLFSYVDLGREICLTHSVFVARLRKLLKLCGYDPALYSGHSFRRGGCTLSFEAGLSLVDIKLRGDWRSHAFERYLFVSPEKIFASARAFSNCVAHQSLSE
jgi:hypothetical protein